MRKLPEGSYNKAFILDLDNGKQVIARIPNPNAGPSRLITASEVATIAFARSYLGVPVPAVLDWSTRSDRKHNVGSDFIIMDVARGVELNKVWDDLELGTKMDILKGLVESVEAKFTQRPLPAHGSLYYSD